MLFKRKNKDNNQECNPAEKISVFDLDWHITEGYGSIKREGNRQYREEEFSETIVAYLVGDPQLNQEGRFFNFKTDKKYKTLEFTIWAESGSDDLTVFVHDVMIDVTRKPTVYTIDISRYKEIGIYFDIEKDAKIIVADPVVY